MAKIIYACSRRVPFGQVEARKLARICKRLEPDNLSLPASHKVIVEGTLACGIVNNRNAVIKGHSVLLGCLYGTDEGWETPRKEYPDGSYAIFRNGSDRLEVVCDATASRTIWYCLDNEYFVASTSQRAIVMFLGSLDFNDRVIPWMLSTGSLGPDSSWDRRIKRLPPDSSIVLDKERWSISVDRRPIVFSAKSRSHSQHKELLMNDIRTVIQSLNHSSHISFNDYLLPLSGGYDSRAILCFLTERGVPENLKAITWGLEENINREGNDAAVAKELASRVGVEHRYFHTDVGDESVENVIDRFICCGEGRVDHVSAYMDGLETWRKLLEEEGCSGIIRGDEGLGWIPVSSELTVRLNLGMGLCADYRNLDGVIEKFQFPKQELPVDLHRREGETLSTWRDRLYHAYRLPTILAALSDLKYSYVETINPLLARSILHRVRELPDRLRTHKALFKEIVNSVSPDVPYAKEDANENLHSVLRRREIVELMRNRLQSEGAKSVFDRAFLDYVLRCIRDEDSPGKEGNERTWHRFKSLVPRSMKNWIRDRVAKPSLDGNALAFRVFLILRMHEVLNSDCAEVAAAEAAPSKASSVPWSPVSV
jgi:asparagine synthase